MKKLEKIIKEKEAAEDSLLKLKNVTGVDVGYKYVDGERTDEVTIRVHVKEKKDNIAAKDRVPEEINGIKTDVIEMEIVPFVLSQKVEEITANADTNTYPTIKGGVSIGPERSIGGSIFAGTLGVTAKDNTTNNPVLLSNFHVMCVDNSWHVGDFMCQPSRIDTGTPVTDRVGALHRAILSSHVDGAISTLSGRPSSCSIVDIGTVKGTASAVLNSPVRKRGRTTLFTKGFVDAINATINVNYGPGIGVKTFTNQIGIRSDASANPKFSDHGDSGSVVVNADTKIIGLLFAGTNAGYTYINPISYVLSELNISICTSRKNIIKEIKNEKLEIKEHKREKIEIKEHKLEKSELKDNIKEHKIEKLENKEFKEFGEHKNFINDKVDKPITDKLDKPFDGGKFREIPDINNPGINPGINQGSSQGTQEMNQRMANLEEMMSNLSSFIASELRPDLSSGALNSEEDIHAVQQKMEKDVADSMGY